MKTLNNIFNDIKNQKTQSFLYILTIIILVFFIFFIFKGVEKNSTKNELTRLKQNIAYYQDSLRTATLKTGELVYERDILAATSKDLKDLSANLYNEVKKQNGQVISLTQINVSLKNEIIELRAGLDTNIYLRAWPNGEQSIAWAYDSVYSPGNERHLASETWFKFLSDTTLIDYNSIKIKITKDINKFSLITGLEEDKETNLLKIFVRSDYPGFTVSKIDGVIIDPQKSDLIKSYFPTKKFGIGFQVGYGLGANNNGIIRLGPYLGIGISYNLIRF